MELFNGSVGFGTLVLLLICLFIALSFEFVNGFHDTANAVATVIYTRSLKPIHAVLWSGMWNFIGVVFNVTFFGGAVAFGIVHLLPVDLLINIGGAAGILMVLSLLLSAIIWNAGTWYLGLPASSSHSLIGSILGVGLASSLFSGKGFGSGVNWAQALKTGESLLFSPLAGFFLAAGLLLLLKALVKNPELYGEPHGEKPPPLWIRGILVFTCTGVSFFHGSNDGQKGIGLMMLILIGLLPTQYALNHNLNPKATAEVRISALTLRDVVTRTAGDTPDDRALTQNLLNLETSLDSHPDLKALTPVARREFRTAIMEITDSLDKFAKAHDTSLSKNDKDLIKKNSGALRGTVDFVVPWVMVAVAVALGLGTTIGWHRIVVTVGEKIGKTHLTYAQGASAEIVAMCMIFAGDHAGLPVSTTHVLSSGVAGTMAANKSGLQMATIRNIALAWILTLPATMLISGLLFSVTAGPFLHRNPPPPVTPRTIIAPLSQ